ncbi:MAG: hypothetical protein OHK0039_39990 [Bacteroidia bacterium]
MAPSDFSDAALHAARYALYLAAGSGARLHLVHVGETGDVPPAIPLEALRTMLQPTGEETAVEIELHEATGAPADALLLLIDELTPDLVVIGRSGKGRGEAEGIFAGSVAQKLALRATVPILIVPEAAVLPPHLHRILYASDFRKGVGHNLAYLRERFAHLDPEIHCLHLIEPNETQYYHDELASIEAELQAIVESEAGVPDVTYKVMRGYTLVEGLQHYAAEHHIDVLVFCPRRRNLFSFWYQRSTTARFVRHSDIPVLTLPQKIIFPVA